MNSTNIELAERLLWDARTAGNVLETLPSELRPRDRPEGYAIQALLERRSQSALFGWKIAATSTAGQQHIGVSGPLAGRLLAEQVYRNGATLSLNNNRMKVAECEFAFTMKHSLEPTARPYSTEQVLEAVGSLHPAIEVPDSRFSTFETVGVAQLIADAACTHQFILGQAATCNWRTLNLATHAVTASVTPSAGAVVHHHGSGANVLGDPRLALTWLVNELNALGLPLLKGQVVTTGTCIAPIKVTPGDKVLVSFGPIGDVRTEFSV